MITLRSVGMCILCLPVPVRPVVPHTACSSRTLALFHFWHQTQGEELTTVMAEALGTIDGYVIALQKVSEEVECPECLQNLQDGLARFLGRTLLELAGTIRRCLPWPDRSALREALAARNAAIEGDAAKVDAFSQTWLGLSRPAKWREAMEMALLGNWVHMLGHGTADTPTVVDLLWHHAQAEHRHLQPLWEHKVRGRRATLLGRPVGDGLTLGDLLVAPGTLEDAVLGGEFADSRLAAVLPRLRAEEETVARDWARTGDAWAQAAAAAGLPEAYGERVRRKLKRLGAQHTARAAAVRSAGAERS